MFARMIDDFKDSTGRALRLTSLAAVMALALGVTISFLCAAAFVYVLQRYGLIEACLTGAGVFLVVTLIAAGSYVVRKRQVKARAAETAKSGIQSALADPMLVATGVKRLIPLLAVAGLALGFLATRAPSSDEAPAE
jgi:hypothetical protein